MYSIDSADIQKGNRQKISICALVFGGIKTYDSRVYTCASVG